ncbi:MAG: hypothetical protein R3293_15005 [Candidatus Promineifilaceae bacterium]|nr:hypothetical protein [Candidatus Promineifilaceae bacterium]
MAQFEQALAAENPDLVILAVEPYGPQHQHFFRVVLAPLLYTLNRPILIVTSQKGNQ